MNFSGSDVVYFLKRMDMKRLVKLGHKQSNKVKRTLLKYCCFFFRSQIKWYHHIADFANLLKAFIGTNYFSLAFGFRQSGLVVSKEYLMTATRRICEA